MRAKTSRASRRAFLAGLGGVGGAVAGAGLSSLPFRALAAQPGFGSLSASPDYGPLVPTPDETTGFNLLKLPEGFRYRAYGWTAYPMSDGRLTPPAHDGMGVVSTHGDWIVIARNHEIPLAGTAMGPASMQYDPLGLGGVTGLVFDQKNGVWGGSWLALAGTSINCAGGPTPWGTWLSCEETLADTADGFTRSHGWIFEIAPLAPKAPIPLSAMGRLRHEAVAVEPVTGIVYETEDQSPRAGFYRFVPDTWGRLSEGGTLSMLAIDGAPGMDLRGLGTNGAGFDVTWVAIGDPTRAHSPGTTDGRGVFAQGEALGGAAFGRLEGCWHDSGDIYFVATNGGPASKGQVFRYEPRFERLTLLFASPGASVLDNPDNVTVSPRGGVILCEDAASGAGGGGDRLMGLTPDGQIFPFAENAVPAFESSEWAGACFSPDGRWLFANIQIPGVTFAITGPWTNGAL